jgi:hypothetical protein
MRKSHQSLAIGAAALLVVACLTSSAHAQLTAGKAKARPGKALTTAGQCDSWEQSGWLNQLSFSTHGSNDHQTFHTRFRLGDESLDIGYHDGFLGLGYRSPNDDRSLTVPIQSMHAGGGTAVAALLRRLSPEFRASMNAELLDLALSSGDSAAATIPFEIAVVNIGDTSGASAASLTAQRSILDCGSYAACYWGCVAGGGGWLGCGYSCNGGGAGEGRCY